MPTIRVNRDEGLSLAWFSTRLQPPELVGVFVVKTTWALHHDAPPELLAEGLAVSGDQEREDGGGLSYASDFVPFKPSSDVLLQATAHARPSLETRHLQVGLSVGPLRKTLLVVGDRRWRRGLLDRSGSDAEPFTEMPIVWSRAFGGPGDPANPVGTGRKNDVLPNIELRDRLIQSARDRLPPAGFGPIPADWEPRARKIGTYGGDYLARRWPFYPADMEWGYFSAAPSDQQVAGYLRGDEPVSFENLHREHAEFRFRLPSQRARCCITVAGGEFREVPMRLDTMWCDLEAERMVLVWRGFTPVQSFKLKDVEHVLAVLDPLEGGRTLEELRDLRFAAEPVDAEAEAEDREFEARMAALEAEAVEDPAAAAAAASADAGALADADADYAALEQQAAEAAGMAAFEQPVTPEPALADDFAELEEIAARLQPGAAPDAPIGLEAAAPDEPEAEPEAEVAHSRDSVAAAAAARESLADADLNGLDLSGLDLSGADLRRSELNGADLKGTLLRGADLTAAQLTGTDCTGADFSGARLDGVDFTDARVPGARFREASIAAAALEGLDLSGLDFQGCKGKAPSFVGSALDKAVLRGAELPKVDLSGCSLQEADLRECRILAGQFEAANLRGADCTRADLAGLHATEADFTNATLQHANLEAAILEDAVFDGADLSYAVMTRAILSGAGLVETNLSRTELSRAVLDDARLQRARILQANLLYCSLERADFTGADLRWSNLYGCGTWEAVLDGADLQDANIGATMLERS